MKSMKAMATVSRGWARGWQGMAAAILVAVVLVGTIPAYATVVTFTINNNPGDTPVTPTFFTPSFSPNAFPGFGDNVSSLVQTNGSYIYHYDKGYGFTPNLTLAFTETAALTSIGRGQRYYHDASWPQVDFLYSTTAATADRKFYYTFTPTTATNGVRINSFDLFGYLLTINHTATWTIYQDSIGGTVLTSGTAIVAGNYQANRTTVNAGSLEYLGTAVLEIHHTAGNGGGFALDNLNFDQIIPEPSCSLLFVLGGLAVLRKRRT